MINSEMYNLSKRYKYLFDVYSISLAQYTLLKKLYEEYDSDSNVKEIELVIIQALTDSITINLCKILLDSNENKVTINNLINNYNRYVKESNNTKLKIFNKHNTINIESEKIKIRNRRNGIITHSTEGALSEKIVKETQLTFKIFERVFEYLSGVLGALCVPINGYSISGWNTVTGKFGDDIAKKIEIQFEMIQDHMYHYNLMHKYIKNKDPWELINIVYSKKNNKKT